jgi:uncharacterized protein (TIGR03435 family)
MPFSNRAMATILIVAASAAALSAQLTFDVASIRKSSSLHEGGTMGPKPGRFFAANVPATAFITFGHNIKSYQLIGAPDWARTDRYLLDATTGPNVTMDQIREMMRSLLEERFKLRVHRETRQLDGYALVRISNDRLGPSMQASTLNCRDPKAVQPQGGRFSCGMTFDPGSFVAGDITTAVLADLLTGHAGGRVVVDKTGMSGGFDVELKWAPDLQPSDLPSIFTAVQEQLGLKLVSEQVPAEVVVIDHIERPSEN